MKRLISILVLTTLTVGICGSISGTVNFDGKGPKKKKLKMDADPVCGKSHQTPVFRQDFVMDDNNNLANVIVYLKNVDYKGSVTKTQAILDQKGCVYTPHVIGAMAGQELLIKNSDATLHNIHSMAKENEQFNFAMPKVVKEKETSFGKVEEPFYIKCDVHPWMKSYTQVFDHPYYAVTDKTGKFSIANVPDGTYEIVAWQEKFGSKRTLSQSVTVKSGEAVVNFEFSRPKKK